MNVLILFFVSIANCKLIWPKKDQVAIIEGDIAIGGLMMIHERDEHLVCGQVMPQGGIQAIEAMLYTIR